MNNSQREAPQEQTSRRFVEDGNEVEFVVRATRSADDPTGEYLNESEEEGEIEPEFLQNNELSQNNNATRPVQGNAGQNEAVQYKKATKVKATTSWERWNQLDDFQKLLTSGECHVNSDGIILEGPAPKVHVERECRGREHPRSNRDQDRREHNRSMDRRYSHADRDRDAGTRDRGNTAIMMEECDQMALNGTHNEGSESVVTVYRGAVLPEVEKRVSNSSEEFVDNSDESILDINNNGTPPGNEGEGILKQAVGQRLINLIKNQLSGIEIRNLVSELSVEAQPSTSNGRRGPDYYNRCERPRKLTAEEKAELVIKQAEAAKTHMLEVPGKDLTSNSLSASQAKMHICRPCA